MGILSARLLFHVSIIMPYITTLCQILKKYFLACIWLTLQRLNFFIILYKNPVRTSQETHYVSATKPNRLMMFGETVAVYCENHTEQIVTLCGENAEFFVLEQVARIVTTKL
jgi:hypothetical protein